MKIIRNHSDLSDFERQSSTNQRVGFVPTMGALHVGHGSLVKRSLQENDITIVSVFVNPTQFNNHEDLIKYPRTEAKDIDFLEELGCDVAFIPEVKMIYPSPSVVKFNFGTLETVMEGKDRPGHFNGVGIVVSKLFNLIRPDIAYFGEKDLQQLAIIKALVHSLSFQIKIVGCPTERETDGLAMSSRNTRLTEENRAKSPNIYTVLNEVKSDIIRQQQVDLALNKGKTKLEEIGFDVDYLSLNNVETLQPITTITNGQQLAVCVAASIGGVRLIDNLRFTVDQNS